MIAIRDGYGSSEAFGRAFREVHGATPGEARTGRTESTTQPRLAFLLTIEGDTDMHHRIVDKDAFTIAGKHVRVPLQSEGVNPHIGSSSPPSHPTFTTASDRIEARSDQEQAGILAITHVVDPARGEGSDVDYHHARSPLSRSPRISTPCRFRR